jgi:predicted O-methyltransferase YrrM
MNDEAVELIEPEVQPGNMPVNELAVICGIILKEKPRSIFEIGTFNGRTTMNMALNAPDNCKVFTLDLPREELSDTRYRISARYRKLVEKEISGELFLNKSEEEFPEKKKITQLLGDSGKCDFSPYYNSIDFIFIDGSHDYKYVLNDSEIALKLLRNGKGIILWHDYRTGMEVVKAIDTLKKRYPSLDIYHIKDTDFAYLKI